MSYQSNPPIWETIISSERENNVIRVEFKIRINIDYDISVAIIPSEFDRIRKLRVLSKIVLNQQGVRCLFPEKLTIAETSKLKSSADNFNIIIAIYDINLDYQNQELNPFVL